MRRSPGLLTFTPYPTSLFQSQPQRFPELKEMADLFTNNPTDDKFKGNREALGQAMAGLALAKYYAEMAELKAMSDGPPPPDSGT